MGVLTSVLALIIVCILGLQTKLNVIVTCTANKQESLTSVKQMMAYYPATMATGGAGVFMGVVYILGGETIQNILRLDPVAMKIALSGTVLMMIFQVY